MPRPMSNQGGFTLIEVLVATAVIALGLGVFIKGGAQYADYARYIRDRTVAQWVARDQLVEYQLADQWPSTGKKGGDVTMGGMNWHWVADIKSSPDPQVRRIDMRVYRVDDNTSQKNSIVLISGFVTQHPKSRNAPDNNNGNDSTSNDNNQNGNSNGDGGAGTGS